MITAGDKIAKPTAARFVRAKTNLMGIEVAFSFKEPDGSEARLNWVGWLSPTTAEKKGAFERTMETLVEVLGFNGNDSVDANGVLVDPKALAYDKEVKLVVEMEKNPESGKEYPRIKWVNKVGGGSAFAGLTPEVIKNELGSLGFKAAYLAAKKASGQPAPAPQQTQPSLPMASEEDVPF